MAVREGTRSAGSAQDATSSLSVVAQRGSSSAWVLAQSVVAAVFFGLCLIGLLGALTSHHNAAQTSLGVACLVVLLTIQLRYFARPTAQLRSAVSYAVLGGQASLVYLPLLLLGNEWADLPGFLLGSAMLVLPRRAAWLASIAIVASVAVLQLRFNAASPVLTDTTVAHVVILYSCLGTVITGLVVYGLTQFASLVSELHATRAELSRLAVDHERAMFAHDLNNLLGKSLSEIILRGELARRLLFRNPAGAAAELNRILDMSRQALSDVRAIAHRYRTISLDQEVSSVAAMLAAADVEVRADIDSTGLPAAVETALAAALREGVTNMLRHSDLARCEITVRRSAGGVLLDIVNDGALPSHHDEVQPRHAGSGLENLAGRVRVLAGTLTAGLTEDGRYRLLVYLPLKTTPPARTTEPDAPDTGGAQQVEALHRRLAGRATHRLVTAVFAGFFLSASLRVTASTQTFTHMVYTIACMAVLLGVQRFFLHQPTADLHSTLSRALLGAQAVLVHLPLLWSGANWVSLPGFLAGTTLLVFRPVLGWTLFATVLAEVGLLNAALGASTSEIAFVIVSTANSGLATWGLIQLAKLVADLHDAQAEWTRAAVAVERLRFARDVHDLLGLSFSAIVLKGELANRLLPRSPNGAAVELSQILDTARDALTEVRSIPSGDCVLAVKQERASVESVLKAADVEVHIELDQGDLPPQVETVLAAALREGATNMLRHSKVECCEITLVRTDATAQLEMVNDGVPASDDQRPTCRPSAGTGGTGLRNLAERIGALGGELSTSVQPDHRFLLRVRVPLQPATTARRHGP